MLFKMDSLRQYVGYRAQRPAGRSRGRVQRFAQPSGHQPALRRATGKVTSLSPLQLPSKLIPTPRQLTSSNLT